MSLSRVTALKGRAEDNLKLFHKHFQPVRILVAPLQTLHPRVEPHVWKFEVHIFKKISLCFKTHEHGWKIQVTTVWSKSQTTIFCLGKIRSLIKYCILYPRNHRRCYKFWTSENYSTKSKLQPTKIVKNRLNSINKSFDLVHNYFHVSK